MSFGTYIVLNCISCLLYSLQSESVFFTFLICYSYKLISTLQVLTNYRQLYLTFLSLFSLSIVPKGFLFPCSSAFLLNISIFMLFILLIYLILKWYLNNISAYLTYLQFSSFIIRNPIKFLQSVLTINSSIIPYKNY